MKIGEVTVKFQEKLENARKNVSNVGSCCKNNRNNEKIVITLDIKATNRVGSI